MFHFFKYFLLTLSFFGILNFIRSNHEVGIPLRFDIPLVGNFITEPMPVFYLMILAFCAGALLMSLLGALRIQKVRQEKRELAQIKKQEERRNQAAHLEPKNQTEEFPPLYKI